MKKRIVVDIDSELWRQASICAAELQITKKEFLETALKKHIENIRRINNDAFKK